MLKTNTFGQQKIIKCTLERIVTLCFSQIHCKNHTFAQQKIIKCVLWELTCSTLRAAPRMLQNRVPGASWLYFAGWPQNAKSVLLAIILLTSGARARKS
jgi:hypothetical protein